MTQANPLLRPPRGLQSAPDDLQREAAELGASLRPLDLGRVNRKADLMEQLARDLALPTHFGRNWDALYDLLADPETMRPTIVCLRGWTEFQTRQSELAGSLESVLLDAQAALAAAGIPLWVLI